MKNKGNVFGVILFRIYRHSLSGNDFIANAISNVFIYMNVCIVRGGFRKFCHRCYNFVNRHNRLLYYTLIERATFLLYNDVKTMHEKK